MGGLLQLVVLRDLYPLGNVRLRCGFGLGFCARQVAGCGGFAGFGPERWVGQRQWQGLNRR